MANLKLGQEVHMKKNVLLNKHSIQGKLVVLEMNDSKVRVGKDEKRGSIWVKKKDLEW